MKYLKVVLESLDTATRDRPVHGIFSLDAAGRDVAFAMAEIDKQAMHEVRAGIGDFFVVDADIVNADRLATRLAQMGPTLLLEPGPAPLSVVADMLATLGDVGTLHIIADGSESSLRLGGVIYSTANQTEAACGWRGIGTELMTEAVILIYGHLSCESADGLELIQAISECTERPLITSRELADQRALSVAC